MVRVSWSADHDLASNVSLHASFSLLKPLVLARLARLLYPSVGASAAGPF